MQQIRTDLAIEAREIAGNAIGIENKTEGEGEIKINIARVTSDDGAKAIGKPIGEYITIEADRLMERDMSYEEEVAKEIAQKLRRLLGGIKNGEAVLVVGLGNQDMTPDSLGPRTIDRKSVV